MKTFASALLLATLACAENVFDMKHAIETALFERARGELLAEELRSATSGAIVSIKTYENHEDRHISFAHDPTGEWTMTNHIKNMTQGIKEHKKVMMESNSNVPVYTCADREPDSEGKHFAGAFFPTFAGEVTANFPTATYTGECFQNIDFTFNKTSNTTFDVNVNLQNPKSMTCHDNIFFANEEIFHMESFFRKGSHTLHFNMASVDSQADVNFNGINLYGFCSGILGEVESLWNFAKCFVGGLSDHTHLPIIGSHVPHY